MLQAQKLKEAESSIQSLESCCESSQKEKEELEMVLLNLLFFSLSSISDISYGWGCDHFKLLDVQNCKCNSYISNLQGRFGDLNWGATVPKKGSVNLLKGHDVLMIKLFDNLDNISQID